jgi:D-arabinose 1-dehydrogenase-like Zn-dependent alcohol dehydrogenase
VLGLGGLGHLGVQYATKMGYKTIAIARGQDKAPLANSLGAWRYIDSKTEDLRRSFQKLGGAKVVLATVTAGDAMAAILGGLAVNGTLMLIGAAASLEVSPVGLLRGRRSVKRWYSGTPMDSQDTLSPRRPSRECRDPKWPWTGSEGSKYGACVSTMHEGI